MIRSMTAFARTDSQQEWGTLTWEVRSVNHRYLEPHFKLPESLREIEPALRELQRKYLGRGKVESALKYQPRESGAAGFALNDQLVVELNQLANQVNRVLDNPAHVSALEIMKWPGVLESVEQDLAPVRQAAIEGYENALIRIIETREKEGAQLAPMISTRLDRIEAIVAEVKGVLPAILDKQRDNLINKLSELKGELDSERVEQEMVILAQKSDVAEELDRLQAHVNEVRDVLKKKEPIGRQLDFLMQELNREANTLSSKSIVTDTTRAAVELKVLIEQMREQVQNIE
ncbi:MAG: YicC family protein [Pseudomonadales bacterium]|uniref:YicC family protein n=1 Tax=Oleiphilus messinensis TaxID=141451 RepID=A0A1Y0I7L9_9GAMM|nr:YicC/YloC family endoribonuclease [Oleiphilus messinensis]ARU55434.1 hypothetical protein OLMES_1356 [Oleiphilus messinensis]MCG8609613.1 YicC family protein [Pseudomonadales bacterium]